jgi:hypothetical protein
MAIEIFTPDEVGELLRLSPNRVVVLARRGELPFLTMATSVLTLATLRTGCNPGAMRLGCRRGWSILRLTLRKRNDVCSTGPCAGKKESPPAATPNGLKEENMEATYHNETTQRKSDNVDYDEITRAQRAAHLADMRRLSDLAFAFLNAANGNRDEAAELFERSVDLLYEDGALQLWRYRAVLTAIAEGL